MTRRTRHDYIRRLRRANDSIIVDTVEGIALKVSKKYNETVTVMLRLTDVGIIVAYLECDNEDIRIIAHDWLDKCVFGEESNVQEILDSI